MQEFHCDEIETRNWFWAIEERLFGILKIFLKNVKKILFHIVEVINASIRALSLEYFPYIDHVLSIRVSFHICLVHVPRRPKMKKNGSTLIIQIQGGVQHDILNKKIRYFGELKAAFKYVKKVVKKSSQSCQKCRHYNFRHVRVNIHIYCKSGNLISLKLNVY
jgi:hypothetical protein